MYRILVSAYINSVGSLDVQYAVPSPLSIYRRKMTFLRIFNCPLIIGVIVGIIAIKFDGSTTAAASSCHIRELGVWPNGNFSGHWRLFRKATEQNDSLTLVSSLKGVSYEQRLRIGCVYKQEREDGSIHKIPFTGNLAETFTALTTPKHEYYAKELNKAFEITPPDKNTIIEILLSLDNNTEAYDTSERYNHLFNTTLRKRLASISGHDHFDDFLRCLSCGCIKNYTEATWTGAEYGHIVSPSPSYCWGEIAQIAMPNVIADANRLHDAVQHWVTSNVSRHLSNITISNGRQQLRQVFNHYKTLSNGVTVVKMINEHFPDNSKHGYVAAVRYAIDNSSYYARRLHNAFNDNQPKIVIRIFAGRTEIDLHDIEKAYRRLYERTLAKDLMRKKWGPLTDLLLDLLDGSPRNVF